MRHNIYTEPNVVPRVLSSFEGGRERALEIRLN